MASNNGVILFKDVQNIQAEADGDTLVLRIDMSKVMGETGGGNKRYATSHGNCPTMMVESGRKFNINLNVYG